MSLLTSRNVNETVSSWTNSFGSAGHIAMENKTCDGALKVLTATGTVETTANLNDGTGVDMAGIATFMKAGASVTLEQEGFRWYDDDGCESASTAAAAQDTSITAAAGTTQRIRFVIDASGDPATTQYKLQYKLSTDDSWTDVA